MYTEPQLISCVQRVSGDDSVIDIECKFSDGQKFTTIQVDSAFPELAKRIILLLNEETNHA